ncbi:MAG: hypothetical protein AB7U73_11800, partial [Pirellulales bacterium]
LSLFAFIGCTGAVFICGEFYYRFVYEGTDSIAGNATHQAWLRSIGIQIIGASATVSTTSRQRHQTKYASPS